MKPVVLFYSEANYAARYIPALSQQGYEPVQCSDTAVLRSQLGRAAAMVEQSAGPIMVVLAATPSRNRAAAGSVAAWPQAGTLVKLESCDDLTLTSALQLGVDAWCPRNCSPTVLVLALHNLQRRLERAVFLRPHQAQPTIETTPSTSLAGSGQSSLATHTQWTLCEQAWRLRTPAGQNVQLTSAERAFMVELVESPDMSAAHARLFKAMGSSADSPTAKTRLGVLVSRLRHKVARHGAQLPIKSLHSWGYMFSGDIALQQPAESPLSAQG